MKRSTYIIVVGGLIVVSFTLLVMNERDIALIFFGILSGFFTNILNLEEKDITIEDKYKQSELEVEAFKQSR